MQKLHVIVVGVFVLNSKRGIIKTTALVTTLQLNYIIYVLAIFTIVKNSRENHFFYHFK